jgi:clan AA aspartic protease (TIGR02281 family)
MNPACRTLPTLLLLAFLASVSPARAEYYQYGDDEGTISFTDNPSSIPSKYRKNKKVLEADDESVEGSMVTRIRFIQNQILVPVRVNFRGVEQTATFLLDTGATSCTISPELARRLNIQSSDTDMGLARGVGGSVHMVGHTALQSMTVGPYRKTNIEVSVIPTGSNDGLLGMNFLRGLRYIIDVDREEIRWGE